MKYYFGFLLAVMVLVGCKEKPTQLSVYTLDYSENPLSGVEVVVSSGVVDTGQVIFEEQSDVTNSEGVAHFDFSAMIKPGQSGFVAAEVMAVYKGDTTWSTVDIYDEKQNEITLKLNP